MNLSQNQQAHGVEDGIGKGDVGILNPRSPPSNTSLRTLFGEHTISSDQDPEKGVTTLMGKYAKYAGEPPDGGLKAWSVVLA